MGNLKSKHKGDRGKAHGGEQHAATPPRKGSEAASHMVRQAVHIHQEDTPTGSAVWKSYIPVTKKPMGEGATCKVYHCRHHETGQDYAVKKIRLQGLDAHKRGQLMNEIEIMRSLDHPNIIRIHEVFKSHYELCIVMEYCTGGELFDELERFRNMIMPEDICRGHVTNMLRSLAYLHNSGIVHRDLKLENFIFTSDKKDSRVLKMIDFGFSRTYLEGGHMTSVVGTSYYIAPEVIKRKYGKEADMWSMGCIVYMLLTGELPFPGETDQEVLDKVKNLVNKPDVKYGKAVRHRVRISLHCQDFINACMKVNPKDRPTALQALEHPWIKNELEKLEDDEEAAGHMKEVGQSLARFKKFSMFKKVAMVALSVNMPTEDLTRLKQIFLEFDKDHTGTITHEEFCKALSSTSLGKSSLDALFDAVDQDHTGYIKYSEFVAACLTEKDAMNDQYVVAAFNALDLDGDGSITREEMKTLLGDDVDDKALDRLMKEADFYKDGVISLAEFKRAMCMDEVPASPIGGLPGGPFAEAAAAPS